MKTGSEPENTGDASTGKSSFSSSTTVFSEATSPATGAGGFSMTGSMVGTGSDGIGAGAEKSASGFTLNGSSFTATGHSSKIPPLGGKGLLVTAGFIMSGCSQGRLTGDGSRATEGLPSITLGSLST